MALHSTTASTAPSWRLVARSAALAYLRLALCTVSGLFALFGGVQLAATRQGSTLVTCLAGTVLLVAVVELVAPGAVSRDAVPHRLARRAAAVPVALTWLALAVVIGSNGGAAVLGALGALLRLAVVVAVFAALVIGKSVATRDPYFVAAFRADR